MSSASHNPDACPGIPPYTMILWSVKNPGDSIQPADPIGNDAIRYRIAPKTGIVPNKNRVVRDADNFSPYKVIFWVQWPTRSFSVGSLIFPAKMRLIKFDKIERVWLDIISEKTYEMHDNYYV